MPSIAALVSAIVAFFAAALLLPAAVAFATGDGPALEAFGFLAIAYGFLAALTMMAMASRLKRLNRAGVFYASIAMWVAFATAAVPPFMLIEGLALPQAVFEAVSAAVTLGVSFQTLKETTAAMELYRSLVAWQGGLLTLLLAIYVLGRYRVGGTPNSQIRLVMHSKPGGDPKLRKTFIEVFVPYLAITILCIALLIITRLDPADALKISLNIVSTNGYFPVDTGASLLNNTAGEIVLVIFMIVGATSIIWHRALLNRQWQPALEQTEASVFLGFIAALSAMVVVGTYIFPVSHFTSTEAILNGIFDIVSIMTTTGITHDARYGINLPIGLILAIALVGGCSFSTAGGIKIFRLSSMLRHSGNEIRRLVYPHMIIARSVGEDETELTAAKAIWSALFIAVLTIMVATLLFALNDNDLASSLGLAVGIFSSTGNLVSSSLALEPGMVPSDFVLTSLAVLGIIARIELLVLLAIFSRTRW